MNKINEAFDQFDEYNKQDPNKFLWDGQEYPETYFMAVKLHEWILKIEPAASEALLLASRSQHIGRWELPRESFPEGREGYLLWRKTLTKLHADKSAEILSAVGYSEEIIQQVRKIILKQKIKVDEEVQTMENALCLVFLAYQYEEFYVKHPDKIVNILKKSLLKMDAHGHRFALSINYSEKGLYYIKEALKLLPK